MTRFFESTKSGMFTKEKYFITNDRLTGWIHTYKGSMLCPLFFPNLGIIMPIMENVQF